MSHPSIAFSLYGAFDVRVDGRPFNLGLIGTTRSLLQFLVCSGDRLVRREHLMETFWGWTNCERRRSSLSSAVWRIKKALRAMNAPSAFALDANADCLRLTGTSSPEIDIDIVRLAGSLGAASAKQASEEDVERLVTLLEGCNGVPLDGVDDDWALVERERLTTLRNRGLSVAMRLLSARRRFDEALECGQRVLLHDPFHESAVQEVICIHALNGQRVRGLRLFEEFAGLLRHELGIDPLPETRALRDYLAGDDAAAQRYAGGVAVPFIAAPAAQPGVGELFAAIHENRGPSRFA